MLKPTSVGRFVNIIYVFMLLTFAVVACDSSQEQAALEQQKLQQQAAQEQAALEQQKLQQQEQAALEAKIRLAENTRTYWMAWTDYSNQIFEPFNKYSEAYSVQNSQELSQIFISVADALANLSSNEVDPELLELAADAIVIYRRRATLYQHQANILYRYTQFQKANNSSDKAAEAIIRGLLSNDLLVVPKEILEEEKKFKIEWQENVSLLSQINDEIAELIARRDGLRLKLTSRYESDFTRF